MPSLAKYTPEQLALAEEIEMTRKEIRRSREILRNKAEELAARREQYLDKVVAGTEQFDPIKVQEYVELERAYREKSSTIYDS